jgi:hyperosmotically inducible periplasmic protein
MKRQLIVFSLAVVAAVGFVGCASDEAARDSHQRTAGEFIDDKVLQQRVKSTLSDSDVYKFDNVKVETYQGTVQLTGFVDTTEQKRRAEELARNVRGVHNVQNQISLKSDTERVRGTDRDYSTSPNRTNTLNRTTNP